MSSRHPHPFRARGNRLWKPSPIWGEGRVRGYGSSTNGPVVRRASRSRCASAAAASAYRRSASNVCCAIAWSVSRSAVVEQHGAAQRHRLLAQRLGRDRGQGSARLPVAHPVAAERERVEVLTHGGVARAVVDHVRAAAAGRSVHEGRELVVTADERQRARGFALARRTVAKYRDELAIPPCHRRRTGPVRAMVMAHREGE